jgi:hypothetical protein
MLFRMLRLAEAFPDRAIVQTLSAQLSWSHLLDILTLDDPLKREFYAELARLHRWSVRTLRDKIRSMLFERTALSRNQKNSSGRRSRSCGRKTASRQMTGVIPLSRSSIRALSLALRPAACMRVSIAAVGAVSSRSFSISAAC